MFHTQEKILTEEDLTEGLRIESMVENSALEQ